MRKLLPRFLALLSIFFVYGCGNSENFVFTNTNNGPFPGVPAQLAFVQNPAQTTDTDFSTPPVVEVQDAFGDRVPGATNTITVSLVNPGPTTLNGQTTRDAVDGQAVFTGLSVDMPGTYTLTCSAPNLQGDESATFTVTPRLGLFSLSKVQGAGMGGSTQLIQLNPETGEYSGSLGFLESPGTVAFVDLECLPDGTVYAAGFDGSGNSDLVLVNMNDPSNSTKVFDITGADNLFSLAYDANNQIMYAIGEETDMADEGLYTLDLSTGVATAAPNTLGNPREGGYGLAFDDSTNTLFFTDGDSLYTIDTTTGIATVVAGGDTIGIGGSTGRDAIRGLDFNPNTNQLFGVSRGGAVEDTGAASKAGIINTSTGTSTQTGFSPHCSGLAFCQDPAVTAGPARQTGYIVSAITQAFEDISTTGAALGLSDDGESDQALGFTFNFDGTDYTEIEINDNGYASFVDTSGNTFPELLPTTELDDDTLLVFWDNLDGADPTPNGDIYVETLGTAPNQRFVVQWNINHNAGFAGTINCQLVLYEGTNVIEYHYDDVTFGNDMHDAGQGAVVGIQTNSTTADIWSIFQPVITNTTAIRFTPPTP